MTEEQLNAGLVSDARAITRNLFGSQLEDKASDAFCLNVLRSRAPAAGRAASHLESLTAPHAPGSATAASVIEFDRGDAPQVWGASSVAGARTAAYQQLSAVYDEVERQSGMSSLEGVSSSGAHSQAPVLVTQVCWLNRTIRTWASPGIVAQVSSDPAVVSIDVPRRLMPDLGPGGLTAENDDASHDNGHAAVGLQGGQTLPFTGKGVIVAVIDSEVASQHPALLGRVVHRRNYTKEPWGNPGSHGTAVAGVIASNDAIFPGVAPGAVIYNYKVLATNSLLNGDDFAGALAVQHALEDGAAVANCSWGAGPTGTGKSREAIAVDTAWALGMVIVKSAGNRGPGAATMTTPADADGVIVVGATDLAGRTIPPYSSRGPTDDRPGPHCVAPGGDNNFDGSGNLRAALVSGAFGDAGAGTSYAAPFVSGAAALHIERDSNLDPNQVRQHLVDNASSLAGQTLDAQGNGLLRIVL